MMCFGVWQIAAVRLLMSRNFMKKRNSGVDDSFAVKDEVATYAIEIGD